MPWGCCSAGSQGAQALPEHFVLPLPSPGTPEPICVPRTVPGERSRLAEQGCRQEDEAEEWGQYPWGLQSNKGCVTARTGAAGMLAFAPKSLQCISFRAPYSSKMSWLICLKPCL